MVWESQWVREQNSYWPLQPNHSLWQWSCSCWLEQQLLNGQTLNWIKNNITYFLFSMYLFWHTSKFHLECYPGHRCISSYTKMRTGNHHQCLPTLVTYMLSTGTQILKTFNLSQNISTPMWWLLLIQWTWTSFHTVKENPARNSLVDICQWPCQRSGSQHMKYNLPVNKAGMGTSWGDKALEVLFLECPLLLLCFLLLAVATFLLYISSCGCYVKGSHCFKYNVIVSWENLTPY